MSALKRNSLRVVLKSAEIKNKHRGLYDLPPQNLIRPKSRTYLVLQAETL